MGSSAQISSGVCRCGSQEQVPEEGSGRFRKVPESSGVCWCRFRRRVPEGSARLVPEGRARFRRVLESSGACWSRFRRQGSEGSGEFRCGLLPCNLTGAAM